MVLLVFHSWGEESRISLSLVITGLVPVIPIGRAPRLAGSRRPGLIPGSSPGTAMTVRSRSTAHQCAGCCFARVTICVGLTKRSAMMSQTRVVTM